jgi:uncharacterized membrane protein
VRTRCRSRFQVLTIRAATGVRCPVYVAGGCGHVVRAGAAGTRAGPPALHGARAFQVSHVVSVRPGEARWDTVGAGGAQLTGWYRTGADRLAR